MGNSNSFSKEAPSEEIDDSFDEIDQLLECWKNRLTIDNLALAKRYAEREIGMGVEVRLEKNNAKQFIAFFERIRRSDCVGRPWSVNFLKVGPSRNDGAVFIDYVETLQAPEGIPQPSSVWLQPSNEFLSSRPHTIKKRSGFCVGEVATVPTYWEVGFIYDLFGSMPLGDDKACGETVQRSSEIVNDVANNPAPLGWDRLDYMNLIDFYCGLRIFISDDSVWLSCSEGRNFGAEVVKVFFGPVELNPAAKQGMVDSQI